MVYIFDVDNTLLFTDTLNNQGYAYALHHVGLEVIEEVPRITKSVVRHWYPTLDDRQWGLIGAYKQAFVSNHLQLATVNDELYHILADTHPEQYALWTAADPRRIMQLLNYFNISPGKAILFSPKGANDVACAVASFQSIFRCEAEELCFFDDDPQVICHLAKHDVQSWWVRHENDSDTYHARKPA